MITTAIIGIIAFCVGTIYADNKNLHTIRILKDLFSTYTERTETALSLQSKEICKKDDVILIKEKKIAELEQTVNDLKEYGEFMVDEEEDEEGEDTEDETVAVAAKKPSYDYHSRLKVANRSAADVALELHDAIVSAKEVLGKHKDKMSIETYMLLSSVLDSPEAVKDNDQS